MPDQNLTLEQKLKNTEEALKLMTEEVDALNEEKITLNEKIEELEAKNAALVAELQNQPAPVETKNTVKRGKTVYKLKYPQANINGKKYTAEDIGKDKEIMDHLIKIGFLTKA